MHRTLLITLLLSINFLLATAGVSLLSPNIGGGGGILQNTLQHLFDNCATEGGGMVKGSSFNLDTKNPRMTRVHGNGIKIDLELLEIATAGGVMKYSPTHVEFVSNMETIVPFSNIKKCCSKKGLFDGSPCLPMESYHCIIMTRQWFKYMLQTNHHTIYSACKETPPLETSFLIRHYLNKYASTGILHHCAY
jgi:hypothetical protein